MIINKSPFPGMDPYLEGEMWQEFHDRLANQISTQLMPFLSPKYVALLNKYYTFGINLSAFGFVPQQTFYPDVHIVEPMFGGGTATLERQAVAVTVPTLTLTSPIPQEVPILTVEIHDVAHRRLVTIIEILSPANKLGKGFKDYQNKRIDILQTMTHLLEIDLLRIGKRLPLLGKLPRMPYFVFLSRFNYHLQTEIWPIGLRETLPIVPVPLLPPDPDVPLNLQTAVEACFQLVGYQRLLDYTAVPPPPKFSDDDLTWLRKCVNQDL